MTKAAESGNIFASKEQKSKTRSLSPYMHVLLWPRAVLKLNCVSCARYDQPAHILQQNRVAEETVSTRF